MAVAQGDGEEEVVGGRNAPDFGRRALEGGTVTLLRFGSIAWSDFDTVSREIAKVIHYAIVESVAGSQQDDQHKNSPRNRKAGQEGTELVLPHRAPDLSQVIKI